MSAQRRLCVLVLALAAAACSVQAPDVHLISEGPAAGQNARVSSVAALGPTSTGDKVVAGMTIDGPEARAACARVPGVTQNEVRIGSSAAMTGPVRSITAPAVKGFDAYINRVNQQGGVFGRTVKLIARDDGFDAQLGKTRVKQLVDQDRVLALTLSSPGALNAAQGFLEERRVPVIGTSGTLASEFESPVMWPTAMRFPGAFRVLIHDAVQRLHARTFAMIWVDIGIGLEVRDEIADAIRTIAPGLSLVASRRVALFEPTFEPVWNDIQNQTRRWQAQHQRPTDGRPDYVIFAIDPANGINALQAAQRLGFRPQAGWGGAAMFFDLVLEATDYASETNLVAETPYLPPLPELASYPGIRDYRETVGKYLGERDVVNPVVQMAWIAAAMTVHVLRLAGPCPTREKMIAAADGLTNWAAVGLTQPMTFRPLGRGNGHYGNTWGIVVQAVPRGSPGCSRSHGCWRWIRSSDPSGWYRDPDLD